MLLMYSGCGDMRLGAPPVPDSLVLGTANYTDLKTLRTVQDNYECTRIVMQEIKAELTHVQPQNQRWFSLVGVEP
jgi:hypothetical protein